MTPTSSSTAIFLRRYGSLLTLLSELITSLMTQMEFS
jgi:hypothetical protein